MKFKTNQSKHSTKALLTTLLLLITLLTILATTVSSKTKKTKTKSRTSKTSATKKATKKANKAASSGTPDSTTGSQNTQDSQVAATPTEKAEAVQQTSTDSSSPTSTSTSSNSSTSTSLVSNADGTVTKTSIVDGKRNVEVLTGDAAKEALKAQNTQLQDMNAKINNQISSMSGMLGGLPKSTLSVPGVAFGGFGVSTELLNAQAKMREIRRRNRAAMMRTKNMILTQNSMLGNTAIFRPHALLGMPTIFKKF